MRLDLNPRSTASKSLGRAPQQLPKFAGRLQEAPTTTETLMKTMTPKDWNSGFAVAINLEAKAGQGDALAEILRQLTGLSMLEPGMKIFQPYRSPSNPNQFFVFELYRDEAAWAEHQATPHFRALVDDLVACCARRERVPFVPFIPN